MKSAFPYCHVSCLFLFVRDSTHPGVHMLACFHICVRVSVCALTDVCSVCVRVLVCVLAHLLVFAYGVGGSVIGPRCALICALFLHEDMRFCERLVGICAARFCSALEADKDRLLELCNR